MTIATQADYEAAMARMRELAGQPAGTPGAETEMNELVELTREWDKDHPSAPVESVGTGDRQTVATRRP